MKKIYIHIGIAIILTTIGTLTWLYRANILLTVKPEVTELEIHTINSSYIFEPEQMLEDFAYLVEIIESVHPDPYRHMGKSAWETKKKTVMEAFKQSLTAAQYYLILSEFTATLRDAHTSVYFEEADKRLLLSFEWVEEGLVIAEDYAQFKKGDLIKKIGKKTPQNVLNELMKIISSENQYVVKHIGKKVLQKKYILEYLKLAENGTVLFTIDRDGQQLEFAAQFESQPNRASTYEKLLEDWHGWSIDKKHNLGLYYLKICIDDDSFRRDVDLFFNAVRSNNIENVVIDVRENIGGNSRVVESFLKHLPISSYQSYGGRIKHSEVTAKRVGARLTSGYSLSPPSKRKKKTVENPFTGNVFVITSNQTFSSGNKLAVIFHDNNLATIVGEPTGNSPSSFGDVLTFQLPNTKFNFRVSYKEFTRPNPSLDPQDSLYPNVVTKRSREDVINNIDPALNYIIEVIS